MEKQLYQLGVARVTLENDMDYTDLIERLRNSLSNGINEEASDAIEALVKEMGMFKGREAALVASNAEVERDLAALRKQIDELQPVAWRYKGSDGYWRLEYPHHCEIIDTQPLFSLEGIKK